MAALRIGHRGASARAPENTLAAFGQAAELECDGVELDIHRTRDGHLVVIHDPWLHRTTNGQGLVRDHALAELQCLDAGAWKGAAWAGERIPTLSEVAHTTGTMRLFIELKAGSLHYPGIEEQLLEWVQRETLMARVQVSSFDHHALRRLRDLTPDLQLGMLYEGNPLHPIAMAREIGANALHPFWAFVTPDLVQAAHRSGLQVHVWTVDDAHMAATMATIGVDGIMSNRPEIVPRSPTGP